jgi:hypothetical protein
MLLLLHAMLLSTSGSGIHFDTGYTLNCEEEFLSRDYVLYSTSNRNRPLVLWVGRCDQMSLLSKYFTTLSVNTTRKQGCFILLIVISYSP